MSSNEEIQMQESKKRSVFVSHASENFKIADEIRTLLEARGIGCWIAPRDISPGSQYGASIVEAIRDCTIMVLLFTDEANNSKAVENEIERAFNQHKTIVPIRLRQITPSKGLEFFVSNAQWLDAIASPLKGRIDQVVNIVHAIEQNQPFPPPEPEFSISEETKKLMLQKLDSGSIQYNIELGTVSRKDGMETTIDMDNSSFSSFSFVQYNWDFYMGHRVAVICAKAERTDGLKVNCVEKIAIFDLTAKSGGQLLSHEDAEGAITPTEAVIEEYSNILPSALEDKFFKIALGVGLIVFLLSLPGFHFSIKGVFSSLVLSVVSVVIIFGLSQLNPKTTKKLLKKRLEEILKSIGCKKCNFEYKI